MFLAGLKLKATMYPQFADHLVFGFAIAVNSIRYCLCSTSTVGAALRQYLRRSEGGVWI
jgi:hypothetical protein